MCRCHSKNPKDEDGHDAILARALLELGYQNPENIQILPQVVMLMDLFKFCAGYNYLAFATLVDMVERKHHLTDDPIAQLLTKCGYPVAAACLQRHSDINDGGAHDQASFDLIAKMAPVSSRYAKQALRLSEFATIVIHQISLNILKEVSPKPS